MTVSLSGAAVTRLATLLLLTSLQPAHAAPDETPEAFVRRVYALYRTESSPGVSMDRPSGAAYYAAPLLDAFAKDSELNHGEIGVIDADPICACQAYDKLRVKSVSLATRDTDTMVARVAISNLGSRYTVTLTLTRTAAGWRIADVGDKDRPSVMAALKDEIAHPIPPDAAPPAQKR